jgi:hypothetical protein
MTTSIQDLREKVARQRDDLAVMYGGVDGRNGSPTTPRLSPICEPSSWTSGLACSRTPS